VDSAFGDKLCMYYIILWVITCFCMSAVIPSLSVY